MPLYTVKVAVKYDVTYQIDAMSRDEAESQAFTEALLAVPSEAKSFEGCPYVIETREPKEAK